MDKEFPLTDKIGKYSGNQRLDDNSLDEPDIDDDSSRELWIDDIYADPDFEEDMIGFTENWDQKISSTIDPSKLNIHIVGESHIDMAWKWRYAQTRKKGISTFKKVLYHVSKFPDFRFAASEPCLLSWIKEDDPVLFQQIKDLVKKGNIELVGGAWIEPDCMMPSGEAFIRQRLYGMQFYRDEFGILPQTEWFLDSFGYNVGLPQILVNTGVKYFWTNKITWNLQTTFPFVSFWWESPDNTKLLTSNFGQLNESFDRWDLFKYGRHLLNSDGKKRWSYRDDYSTLKDNIDLEKFVTSVGYFTGKGDGGHGPSHKDIVELQTIINVNEKIKMNFKWSTAEQYFSEVNQFGEDLPIWADELYLENHRGTFTVHSEVKRHNRRFEQLLQTTESLATIISMNDPTFSYPYDLLEETWKTVLLNQFHDVLPGSSVPEVYDDCFDMWKKCDDSLSQIMASCFSRIAGNDKDNIIIFNPLPIRQNVRVFIPLSVMDNPPDLDESGKPPYAQLVIPGQNDLEMPICQPVAAEPEDLMKNRSAGWWTILELHPYAILTGELVLAENKSSEISVDLTKIAHINNGLVSVEFDKVTGAIRQIKSGEINHGYNLVYGNENGLICGYLDDSKKYPTWNIKPEYWKFPKNYDQTQDLDISIINKGPIFSTIQIKRRLGDSPVVQQFTLFKNDPKIYTLWSADWKEVNTLLKIGFNTNTKAQDVTVDNMYCALSESTLPTTPCDKARYEKVMHTYADLSTPDNSWGLAILNEGKYAFDVSGGRIRLSLHRSPAYPKPSAESWVNIERQIRKENDGSEPPEFTGIGRTSCRFAIFPHKGGCLKDVSGKATGIVKHAAQSFNCPVVAHKYSNTSVEKIEIPPMDFYIPNNIQLSTFKKQEWNRSNSIILRFAEISGEEKTIANILFPQAFSDKIDTIRAVDLLERPVSSKFKLNRDDHELVFAIHKFEIISFEISLK